MNEIDPKTHSQLLYLLDQMPYEQAQLYRKLLQAARADYEASLVNYGALAETIWQAAATKKLPKD